MSTDTLNATARLTITSGPDRGRSCDVTGELTHLGSASGNDVVFTDPQIGEMEVSIIRRQGRHAIRVVGSEEVEVDGTKLPPDRWVWLPKTAQIRLTRRTAVEFLSLLPDAPEPQQPIDADLPASPPKPKMRAVPEAPDPAKGEKKRKGQVAKFITDQSGDPLVRLGEDGHFPELMLQEGQDAAKPATDKSQSANPLILVAAFVVSVGMSVLMLFVDMGTGGSVGERKAVARKAIKAFYGGDSGKLEPYQVALRQAQNAWSQGNYAEERQRYRDVLEMLRSERTNPLTGLTRLTPDQQQSFAHLTLQELALVSSDENFLDLKNDEKLERLIAILLEGR